MTTRHSALEALTAALVAALPGHTVQRATGTPEAIPFGAALVTIHEGACEQAEPILSPLQYEIIWLSPVTIDADTDAVRDDVVGAMAAQLVANPTLDAAVDWAEIGMPEAEVASTPSLEGQGQQPPIFAYSLPVRLHYVADSPAG